MTLKNFIIGVLIAILLLVGYAVHAGIALVHVKSPDTHLWIPIPVSLGRAIGHFIELPASGNEAWEEVLQHREAAIEILRQLHDLPDADFVEVVSSTEKVKIIKRSNLLCVQVDSPREQVRIRVPLYTLERLIEVTEKFPLDVGDLVACLEWQPAGELVHVKTDTEEVRVSIW